MMAGYYSGRKLYRSRDGVLLGVCKGIAEWRDFPVDLVRLAFILLTFVGGFTIWIYFILAFVLPVEPEGYYRDNRYERRKRGYQEKKEDIKTDFENLKAKVNKMEDEELDKERDWDNRFTKDK